MRPRISMLAPSMAYRHLPKRKMSVKIMVFRCKLCVKIGTIRKMPVYNKLAVVAGSRERKDKNDQGRYFRRFRIHGR